MAEAVHRSITRRALLAGSAAAVPAAALAGPPGVPAEAQAKTAPDPVHAAIAAHAQAYAAYDAQLKSDDEDDLAMEALIEVERETAEAFAATVPTTRAGAAAALAYVRALNERDGYMLLDDYDCYVFIASVETAMRRALDGMERA